MEEAKKAKLPGYRWMILLVVCLICFMANYMQYQVSAWGVSVMEMVGTDAAGLTNLMLIPMLAAVFLSIPCGSLADRYGVKKIVCVGIVFAVVGGFLRCFFLGSFPVQLVSMFMLGFGIASLNANLAKVLGTWFGPQTSLAVGFFYAASCLAIVLAQSASTLFPDIFTSYLVAAIAQAVCAVMWFAFMRNTPQGVALPEPEPVTKYLGVAAKNRNVWFIAFAYGVTLASTTAYATILPSALELGRGVETTLAGSMAAIITVGSFFACFAGPAYVVKRGKNKPFLIITTIVGAIIMVTNWFSPLDMTIWVLLVLNGFFTALSGPIIQAMTPSLPGIGTKYAGSAGGIIGTVGLLCSYFIPIAVAAITGDNWALNLTIESVLFLISLAFIIPLPETGSKGPLALKRKKEEAASADSAPVEAAAGSEHTE